MVVKPLQIKEAAHPHECDEIRVSRGDTETALLVVQERRENHPIMSMRAASNRTRVCCAGFAKSENPAQRDRPPEASQRGHQGGNELSPRGTDAC